MRGRRLSTRKSPLPVPVMESRELPAAPRPEVKSLAAEESVLDRHSGSVITISANILELVCWARRTSRNASASESSFAYCSSIYCFPIH